MEKKKNKSKPPIRKKQYETPELFQAAIDRYFDEHDDDGKIISLAGLCCELNLTYEGFAEYGRYEAYSGIAKMAKQRVERWVNEQALKGDITPSIAALNLRSNFKWNDRFEARPHGEEGQKSNAEKVAEALTKIADSLPD